ncbi:MAG: hypothetical protein KC620_07560 [Myxococcales bacterium]|nr:hypothetical protein [Myxococcales bacterium]
MTLRAQLGLLALGFALAACGAAAEDAGAAGADEEPSNFRDGGAGEGPQEPGARAEACAFDDDCADGYVCFGGQCIFQGTDALPPPDGADAGPREEEVDFVQYGRPAAGRAQVFVASPQTDSVVRIHAETLAIGVIEVGDEPTELYAVPGEDTVVVLNHTSDELAIVTAEDTGDSVRLIALPYHFNALTLDPAGRFAFCWFDLSRALPGEDGSAVQDVAVVDLAGGAVSPVAVGFRPRRVGFTADGRIALVVTEDGVSVIDPAALDGPTAARTVPVAPDVFRQADREVILSPDGAFAASRGPGEPGVTLVELAEGVPRFVPLGAVPTDLDLLPDGRTALAVLRSIGQLALVPMDTAAADPETIRFVDLAGRQVGAAVADAAGEVAVLYTTVAGAPPRLTLLDLTTEALVDLPLRKGVRGVALDPSGGVAFVLHDKAEGDPAAAPTEADLIARSDGYSLVDLRTGFVKLQTTPAEPFGLVFAPDRPLAMVLLADPARRVASVQRIDLAAFDVRDRPLGSTPEAAGLLPAVERAFVTQTHPEGRISFIPLDGEGRVETVSGYTLNGRIE